MKIINIFSTIHDPQDWDLIYHSDGEYFEVSSSYSESSDNEIPEIRKLKIDSESFDSDEPFIPDIKMFSLKCSGDIQENIAAIKTDLAQLDLVQFTTKRRLTKKLENLEKQLLKRKKIF